MEKDFSGWLTDHIDELPVPKEQIRELLKVRPGATWSRRRTGPTRRIFPSAVKAFHM